MRKSILIILIPIALGCGRGMQNSEIQKSDQNTKTFNLDIDHYLLQTKKIRIEEIKDAEKYGTQKYYHLTDTLQENPILVVNNDYAYANFNIDDKFDSIIILQLYKGNFNDFKKSIEGYGWVRGEIEKAINYSDLDKKTIYFYKGLYVFVDNTNNSKEKRLGFANSQFLNSFLIQ